MQPLVDNATDRRQQHRADKKLKDRRTIAKANWQGMLARADGRFVLWDVLEKCGVFGSVFSTDPLLMARNAGRQDLGHELMILISEAEPNALELLLREGRERERRDVEQTVAEKTKPASETPDTEESE